MSENTQRLGLFHSLHAFFRRRRSAGDAPARTQRSWWSRLLPSFLRRRRPSVQRSETHPHLQGTPSSPHNVDGHQQPQDVPSPSNDNGAAPDLRSPPAVHSIPSTDHRSDSQHLQGHPTDTPYNVDDRHDLQMTHSEASHDAEVLQLEDSHSIPIHSPRSGDDLLNTRNASKTGRLKEAVKTGLVGLKAALDVAEKFSDIIPVPVVGAVIGGLHVLLERQKVWCITCLFLALTDHATD